MSGVLLAYRGELRKLIAQRRTWLGILTAALVPVVFLISIQISKVTPHDGPYDTPLGPNLRHSGVVIDLVVLKLVAVIGPTLIAALVAGDIVTSEDMGGTLKTILVRSLRRGHLLAGKALAVFTYLTVALSAFVVVGELAGIIAWGFDPLTNLSGDRLSPLRAPRVDGVGARSLRDSGRSDCQLRPLPFRRHAPQRRCDRRHPALRAGPPRPSALSAIAPLRPYLLVTQLTAWHDLFQTPVAGDAIVRALWVSALFTLPPLAAAALIFGRRDVTT